MFISVNNLLNSIYMVVIQVGDGLLLDSDCLVLLMQLQGYCDQLLMFVNLMDGVGNYLFVGFKMVIVLFLNVLGGGVIYSGDIGLCEVQIVDMCLIVQGDNGVNVFLLVLMFGSQLVLFVGIGNIGIGMIGGVMIMSLLVVFNVYQFMIVFGGMVVVLIYMVIDNIVVLLIMIFV